MEEIAHGVLFYASLYVNGILLITGISTGRWVFTLLILLTVALTAYMMFLIHSNADHLKAMGEWAEKTVQLHWEKVKRFF